ncbi:MAG: Acyltransferase domain protein [Myxococcaceae bacterium]|nr:Acyltransferase domain protein [Myxococcaceae bacterium]
MTRTFLRWLFRRVVQIYFREIEIVGELPDASVGGRIFAANHVNGLVDPILVLTTSPCVVSPIGKAPLWKIPVLRWLLDAVDAVPIVRRRDDPGKTSAANDEVFAKVAAHLGKGGNILIFPEGTSHNEPHLVPLRSGAGRMLAKAHEGGARGLTFQSVGLEFEARDIFRSRTLVVYGPVRSVDALAAGSLASDVDALAAAITAAWEVDEHVHIERFAPGREVTCGVHGTGAQARALPPTEIRSPNDAFYTYQARYAPGRSEHLCPAPIGEALVKRVQEIAVAAHRTLGCRDLCRADFVVDDAAGEVTLLEINTMPGFTDTSLYPEAAGIAGMAMKELCDGFVQAAVRRGAPQRNLALALPR